MGRSIDSHIHELLAERDEHGITAAKRIAMEVVNAALKGEVLAIKICMDSQLTYDPTLSGRSSARFAGRENRSQEGHARGCSRWQAADQLRGLDPRRVDTRTAHAQSLGSG